MSKLAYEDEEEDREVPCFQPTLIKKRFSRDKNK